MSALDYSLDALEQAVKAWQQERAELRAALADMLYGWRYIRQSHGDLYGVGWDRAQEKAEKAFGIARNAPVPDDCFTARIKSEFAPITQPQEQSCK